MVGDAFFLLEFPSLYSSNIYFLQRESASSMQALSFCVVAFHRYCWQLEIGHETIIFCSSASQHILLCTCNCRSLKLHILFALFHSTDMPSWSAVHEFLISWIHATSWKQEHSLGSHSLRENSKLATPWIADCRHIQKSNLKTRKGNKIKAWVSRTEVCLNWLHRVKSQLRGISMY